MNFELEHTPIMRQTFAEEVCIDDCGPRLSEQRQLTVVAAMLIVGLMGIQALQNLNEGILCCSDESKNKVHNAIGLERFG